MGTYTRHGHLILVMLAGCFNPHYEEGIRCSRQQTCPGEMVCDPVDNRCRLEPLAPTCDDGVIDGDETDVDCGGATCPACAPGDGCSAGTDCQSGVCDIGESDQCLAPACDDSVRNGAETDVDCGGPECPACPDNATCEADSDCASDVCDVGSTDTCLAPVCDDQVQNGAESDIDCGGMDCPSCAAGQTCVMDADCATGFCVAGLCGYQPSCQAILEAGSAQGDGSYDIDPDGMGGDPPFTVTCDMSTDGGGWTCIEPTVAFDGFGVTMTDLASTGNCSFNGPNPQGNGTTGINCRFDMDIGFPFDTVRTSGVIIEVIAALNNTSDLSFVDQPWGAIGACGSVGDVHFGTPAHPGAALSLGDHMGILACGASVQYGPGVMLTWDGAVASTTEDTVLRLELGEQGGQNEGWRWLDGCVMVRDETP